MCKKVCFLSFALTLLISVFTVGALAADGNIQVSGAEGYVYENGVLTVETCTPLTLSGASSDRIVIAEGITADLTFDGLTLSDVADYQPAVTLEDGATLKLTIGDNGAELTGGKGRAALEVPRGTHLIITEDSIGTLTAVSGEGATSNFPAAIGGSARVKSGTGSSIYYTGDVGSITINGGTVVARSANITSSTTIHGAGIGAAQLSSASYGHYTSCGTITINGGTVMAAGSPAIGGLVQPGGENAAAQGSVTVNGGAITATTLKTLLNADSTASHTEGGILAPGGSVSIRGGAVNIYGISVCGRDVYAAALGGANCTLTIQDQADIIVQSPDQAAPTAVGGPGSTVLINGGALTVQSDAYIGIGADALSGDKRATVEISDGTVVVKRSSTASIGTPVTGIGGNACDVLISGGEVSSIGYYGGAAIGASKQDTYDGTVTITGGTVTAEANKKSTNALRGADIGASQLSDSSYTAFSDNAHVTILGGTVIAKAGGIRTGGHFHAGEDGKGGALIYATIDNTDMANAGQWNTVVFSDTVEKNGVIYGEPALSSDATLRAGYKLTVPAGGSFTVSKDATLTLEEGSIFTNSGTVDLYGTLLVSYATAEGPVTASFVTNEGAVFNWYGQVSGTPHNEGGTFNYATVTELSVSNTAPTVGDEDNNKVTFTATVSRRDEAENIEAGGTVSFYRGDVCIGTANAVLLEDEPLMVAELTLTLEDDTWAAEPEWEVYAVYEGAKGAPTCHLDSESKAVTMEVSLLAALDAEKVTAVFGEDSVALTVDVTRPSEDATVLAAAYDEYGRMVAAHMVRCARGQDTLELTLDCDSVPVKVTVFVSETNSLRPVTTQVIKQFVTE